MKTVNSASFSSNRSSTSLLLDFASWILSSGKGLLVAYALCFGIVSTARAAIIFVNSAQTTMPQNGQSWETAYKTFGDALASAKSMPPGTATQIWIAPGYYSMPTLEYTTLPDKVEIYGGFQGGETAITDRVFSNNLPVYNTALYLYPYFSSTSQLPQYVFHLVGTTNTFSGVQFIGAGGILQEGGALTIANCLFSRWAPSGVIVVAGTGIFASNGATLKVQNSSFLDGLASRGGAIAAENAASVTITGSTFSGNRTNDAQRSEGGAIEINGNQTAPIWPAAITTYGVPQQTIVTLDSNVFTNNSSYLRGGAISIANADTVSITNSTFGALDNNGTPNPNNSNKAVQFSTVYAPGNGGAIWLSSSNSEVITNNLFYGNVASNVGGAIYSTAQNNNGSVSITFNKFIQNNAGSGGAIADASEKSSEGIKTVTLDISNNTFTNNTASKGPAILYDFTQLMINGKSATAAIDNALTKSNPTLRLSDISP